MPPGDIGYVWRHFIVTTWGRACLLLAFSGQRPGMLLNILRAQDSPTAKTNMVPNVDSADDEKLNRG